MRASDCGGGGDLTERRGRYTKDATVWGPYQGDNSKCVCRFSRHLERERETETETERQRDRETERQTDRQTDRETEREREGGRERECKHPPSFARMKRGNEFGELTRGADLPSPCASTTKPQPAKTLSKTSISM